MDINKMPKGALKDYETDLECALMVKQIINIGDKVPNVDAYYFETNKEEFNDLTEKLGQYIKNIYEESQRK